MTDDIEIMPGPTELLAQAVSQLADALTGYRTTRIGRMSITERAGPYRFTPTPCHQCRSEDAAVRFHRWNETGPDEPRCDPADLSQRSGPHLHCTCPVCGWDWTESLQEPRKSPSRFEPPVG